MYKVLTLNNIALAGLRRFPRERYEVASEITHPDAIILRSYNMHDMDIPETVAAVGRAGAGTNNIPVEALSKRGVPVFNAPGANANAVKELVIAALMIGARNLCDASHYVRHLKETGEALSKKVEAGKKQFVGFELPGRTLGVVGLGAIGVEVANAALALGMHVIGFDPKITVRRAWQLDSGVAHAETLDQLFKKADAVTVHVPLTDDTRGLVNRTRMALMNDGALLINFARGGVVDDEAALAALESGKLHAYVSDFPTEALIAHPKVVALPHLGASTGEAEENSAVMVVDQLRDYLEHGNLRNAVNFPEAAMAREAPYRLAIANANVPDMLARISHAMGERGINIHNMLNKSRRELAYTLVDVDSPVPEPALAALRGIDGVLAVRYLPLEP